MFFHNSFNYVRARHLHLISIEMLAIILAVWFCWRLKKEKRLTLEIAYFIALPFSDVPFRFASVQPVEFISFLVVLFNYKQIKPIWLLVLGGLFVFFSVLGFTTHTGGDVYSLLYSFRFVLTGLVFSIFTQRAPGLPLDVLRFVVSLCFWMTFLQVFLWLAGLPIHGIFYDPSVGAFPRAKGLAQEPATWSIFILMLFPFIHHFKLPRKYLTMNYITLFITLSTFGFICIASYLLIRWCLHGGWVNLKLWKKITAFGVAIFVFLSVLFPGAIHYTDILLDGFVKVEYYAYELSTFAGFHILSKPHGMATGNSGRNSDLIMLKENFPHNQLFGIGSFKADSDAIRQEGVNATNTYIGWIVEVGIVGTILVFVLLYLHYSVLFKNYRLKSPDFLAGALNMFLMIAGIRCFAFHEIWYTQGYVLRTAISENNPLPSNEKIDAE